jgi:hypothetical protein
VKFRDEFRYLNKATALIGSLPHDHAWMAKHDQNYPHRLAYQQRWTQAIVVRGKEHEVGGHGTAAMGYLHVMSAHEVELGAGTDIAPKRPIILFMCIRSLGHQFIVIYTCNI